MITSKEIIQTRELLFQCLHFYIDSKKSDFNKAVDFKYAIAGSTVWSELTAIIQVLSILSSLIEKSKNENYQNTCNSL